MPGPAKQPKALKQLKGTYEPSKEVKNPMEDARLASIPAAPDDLPEAGKQAWYRVVEQLNALKVLTILDYDMLKAYCYQVSVMQEAMQELEKPEGKVVKLTSKSGAIYYVKSPWVGIYNDASAQANRIGQSFGLSPAARSKISLGQVEEKDDFEKFLEGI